MGKKYYLEIKLTDGTIHKEHFEEEKNIDKTFDKLLKLKVALTTFATSNFYCFADKIIYIKKVKHK